MIKKYVWRVEVSMRGGEKIDGLYRCTHSNSGAVAKEIFQGGVNDFSVVITNGGNTHVFFRLGDVLSFSISAQEEK